MAFQPLQVSARLPAYAQHRGLDLLPPSRRHSILPATDRELPLLMELTRRHLPGLAASYEAVQEVHRFSKSILAVHATEGVVGSYAFLFLNSRGRDQLLAGRLSRARPGREHLVGANEMAAALYAWAMCLPGTVVGAMGNIMAWLRQPQYARADLYGRPATAKGESFMVKTGFRPLPGAEGSDTLWVYRREPSAIEEGKEKIHGT